MARLGLSRPPRRPRPATLALALITLVLAALAPSSALASSSSSQAGASGTLPPKAFYVSPHGSNANPGTTASRPLRTIARVQQVVRDWTQHGMNRDVVVFLEGGTYHLSSPLQFGAADSGTDGYQVIWRNYPGQTPVLSGGTAITGWTQGADGIWSASAKGLDFLQLYGPDGRIDPAASPTFEGQLYTIAGSDNVEVQVADSALPDWNLASLEGVQVVLQYTWRQLRYRIASISADEDGYRWIVARTPDGTVNPNAGSGSACCAADGTNPVATSTAPLGPATSEYPTYIEYAPEFLGTNEFSLDTADNTVSWLPPAGVNPNKVTVTAPVTQQLLDVNGTSNVTFYGLQFAYTTWLRPAQDGNMQRQGGFRAEPQAAGTNSLGWPTWYVNPGAVTVQDGSDVVFQLNVFRYLGANGIVLGNATDGDQITENIFSSLSDTGVFIGSSQDPGLPASEQNTDTTVTDNFFDGMGEDYATDSAITATYPNGLTVAHNLIRNVHNIGINIGYIDNLDPTLETSLQNVQILDNRLDTLCTVAADCGAIHTKTNFYYSTSVPRSTISGNYITNVHLNPYQVGNPPVQAIYPDNNTNNLLITNNEWANVDDGIHTNGNGPDNTITDNETGNPYVIANAGLEPSDRFLASLNPDITSIGGDRGPGIDTSSVVLNAPTQASPGSTFTATATFTNGTFRQLSGVTVRLAAPKGFTVSGAAVLPALAPGASAQVSFQVTTSPNPAQLYQLTAQALYAGGPQADNPDQVTDTQLVQTVLPSTSSP